MYDPILCESKMIACQMYLTLLLENIFPTVRVIIAKGNNLTLFFFQQYEDPSHYAVSVRHFLNENFGRRCIGWIH